MKEKWLVKVVSLQAGSLMLLVEKWVGLRNRQLTVQCIGSTSVQEVVAM